jgi:hypothetical protein
MVHQGGNGQQVDMLGGGIELGNGHFVPTFAVGLLLWEAADGAVRVAHRVREGRRCSHFDLLPNVAEHLPGKGGPHQVTDADDGGGNFYAREPRPDLLASPAARRFAR